ncbi:MAG: RluA family pseudouridine synthase, partial [Clostridia bacterium]|nr:RluA family pseudouridine synthase [Clostridia bacterium]
MDIEIIAQNGGRLDTVIAENSNYTRSFIKKLFEQGQITVNGELPKKSGQTVKVNDAIKIVIPQPVEKIEKKDIPIEILY